MKWSRTVLAISIVMAVGAAYLFFIMRPTPAAIVQISDIAEKIKEGQVESLSVEDNKVTIKPKTGPELASYKEAETGIIETLSSLGITAEQLDQIKVTIKPRSPWENWIAGLATILPLILIGGFFFFILRQAQGAGNQALSFGKSRARMFTGDKPTVTFDDVAGVDEAKQELAEIVEFLREPEKFISHRRISGVLYINVSDEQVVERLSARWICRKCQKPYHMKFNPPQKTGLCDDCGGDLYQRDDDNPETVRARLRTFHQQTAPLIDYYTKSGLLIEINGEGQIDNVVERMIEATCSLEEATC